MLGVVIGFDVEFEHGALIIEGGDSHGIADVNGYALRLTGGAAPQENGVAGLELFTGYLIAEACLAGSGAPAG